MTEQDYRTAARTLIAALEAGLASEGGPEVFWQEVVAKFPEPSDLPDGDAISPLAPLATWIALEVELHGGARPPAAVSAIVGHLLSSVLDLDQIMEIANIEKGQSQAHQMLAPILEQPVPPVIIKAMINRLCLALARRTGSVDHALLYMMTVIDRSSHMDDNPPPPPPGLVC